MLSKPIPKKPRKIFGHVYKTVQKYDGSIKGDDLETHLKLKEQAACSILDFIETDEDILESLSNNRITKVTLCDGSTQVEMYILIKQTKFLLVKIYQNSKFQAVVRENSAKIIGYANGKEGINAVLDTLGLFKQLHRQEKSRSCS